MKKQFTIVFCVTVLLCLTATSSYASDFRDNTLSFDSQRLERGEERSTDNSSELSASLFLSRTTVQLEKLKEEQNLHAQNQAKQLFIKKSVKADWYHTKELFTSQHFNQTSAAAPVSEDDTVFSDIVPTLLYGMLAVFLVVLAGFETYRINRGEL